MKNLLLLSMKNKLIVGGVVVALAGGGVTAALTQPQTSGADTSPLVQQVQHNTDELANHDARIGNAENDIKDLQDKTGTPASANHSIVPSVSTTAPTTAITDPVASATVQTPAPVTITRSGLVFGGQYDGYCSIGYSDGSTGYIKATITTNSNGNSQSSQDNCASFVGQTKS